jgi:serine/threonine protein kinase
MFCRKCGEKNPPDSNFCQACGEKYAGVDGGAADLPVDDGDEGRLRQRLAGKFQIVRKLGAGGMAEVYLARDEILEREVAVKVLPQGQLGDEEFVARFAHEARITATLEHPNIIRIYSLSQEPDLVYYTMNVLKGGSLTQLLRREGAQPVERIADWGRQICAALSHAHRQGIIVRDLKPDNVLLDEDGRAVLTDFGIARHSEAGGLTQMGTAIGTPQYMSPEQALGDPVDARTDLYALGVMLYLLSTATLPFNAEEPASLIYLQVHETPEPPDVRNKDVPGWLCDIILQCMEKSPADRFQSAEELEVALSAGAVAESGAALALNDTSTEKDIPLEQGSEPIPAPDEAVQGQDPESESEELVAQEDGAEEGPVVGVNVAGDEAVVFVPPGRRLGIGVLFVALHAVFGGGVGLVDFFVSPILHGLVAQWDWSGPGQRLLGGLGPEAAILLPLLSLIAGVGQWLVLRPQVQVSWRWAVALPVGGLLAIPPLVWRLGIGATSLEGPLALLAAYGGIILGLGAPLLLQWLVARTDARAGWPLLGAMFGGAALASAVVVGYGIWDGVLLAAWIGVPWDGGLVGAVAGISYAVPVLLYLYFARPAPAGDRSMAAVLGALGVIASLLAFGLWLGWAGVGTHGREVLSVGFDEGESRIYSVGNGIKRWDWASGRKVATSDFDRPGQVVAAVADSVGARVLSGLDNGTVVLWDVLSGRELCAVAGYDSASPTAVALGPGGRLLLAASGAGTIRLWNGDTGSEILVLGGRGQVVRALSFSRDGTLFAAAEGDSIRLWNSADGEEVAVLGAGAAIGALAFGGGDRWLLSGGDDGGVHLWDLAEGRVEASFETGDGPILAVAFDDTAGRGVSGAQNGTLRLWDLSARREIAGVAAHRGAVRSLALSPSGEYAVSGGEDGQVYLWETLGGRQAGQFYDLTVLVLKGMALVVVVVFGVAFFLVRRRSAAGRG